MKTLDKDFLVHKNCNIFVKDFWFSKKFSAHNFCWIEMNNFSGPLLDIISFVRDMRIAEAFCNEIKLLVAEVQAILDKSFVDRRLKFTESSNNGFETVLVDLEMMEIDEAYEFLMRFPSMIQHNVRRYPYLLCPVYCYAYRITNDFGSLY